MKQTEDRTESEKFDAAMRKTHSVSTEKLQKRERMRGGVNGKG
jgi:hypothetical protein